jgi:ClpX C4-type zinc finger protein
MARPSNLTICSFCGKSHAEVLRLIAAASGSWRHRVAEASWANDDATIKIKTIEGKIQTESEFPLAALLEGIGKAEERSGRRC